MNDSTYRDLHLLDELTHTPGTTQRELAKRIGVALGLTNLMLRRLAKKGYVKVTGTSRNRLRYLITPKGILEKTRLTYEYLEASLQLYGQVRRFLREQLERTARAGHRRIAVYGTGEMAEIAFLTIRELRLQPVGVVEQEQRPGSFLGYPVQAFRELPRSGVDRVIVCALRGGAAELEALKAQRELAPRLIILPLPALLTRAAEAGAAQPADPIDAAAQAAEAVFPPREAVLPNLA